MVETPTHLKERLMDEDLQQCSTYEVIFTTRMELDKTDPKALLVLGLAEMNGVT